MKKFLYAVVGLILLLGLVVYGSLTSMLHRPEGRSFDSEGVRIHYTDQGSGDPVLLIHGLGLNGDLQWRAPGMIDVLVPDYRVIAIDQRGHGLSDKPHEPGQYGGELIEDVVRLLDHLEIKRAHVVGYSLGGVVTRKLAVTHPDRVISALPAASGWIRSDDPVLSEVAVIGAALELDDFGPLIQELRDVDGPPLPGWIAWLVASGMSSINDGPAIAAAFRGIEGLTITEVELRNNRVPTLTLIGSLDPLLEGLDALDAVTPLNESRVVEGYGHGLYPQFSDFDVMVKSFLDSQSAGAP
jgi:pimeloyl-ACP methyl ester carboxylesterase